MEYLMKHKRRVHKTDRYSGSVDDDSELESDNEQCSASDMTINDRNGDEDDEDEIRQLLQEAYDDTDDYDCEVPFDSDRVDERVTRKNNKHPLEYLNV